MSSQSDQFSLILVTGNSRSGTTLMGELLGTAPDVRTLPELHYFENLVDEKEIRYGVPQSRKTEIVAALIRRALMGFFESKNVGETDPLISHLEDAVYERTRNTLDPLLIYLYTLEELASYFGVRSICDHTGKNVFFLDKIFSLNCSASVIHMVRNPYSVMRSQAGRWRVRKFGVAGIPRSESIRAFFNFNPIFEAIMISNIDKIARKAKSKGAPIFITRYEDVVHDPSNTLGYLTDQLKIGEVNVQDITAWGSSHNNFGTHKAKGIVPTATVILRPKGIRERGSDFWCRIILSEYTKDYCYEGQTHSLTNLAAGLFWIVVTPIQVGLVIILNLRRAKNVFTALKRRLVG